MLYNLLDEEWIPVLYADGGWRRVGIHRAFGDAGRIRQIAASNPLDNVALLRFLLAVLRWCKRDPKPEDGNAFFSADGQFPERWFAELSKHEASFNLFGDERRFYQSKVTSPNDRPVGDLLAEFPTETKIAHLRHVRDKQYGLCPACCALGIIRFCAWANAYGGGRYTSAVNGPAPAYAAPQGATLRETFEVNERELSRLEAPRVAVQPPWLSDDAPTREAELSCVNVFAWRSRRLWLGNLEQSDKPCSYCGRRAQLVRQLAFTGDWKPPFVPKGKQKKFWDRDPHLIFVEQSASDDSETEESSDSDAAPEVGRTDGPKKKQEKKNPDTLTTLGFPSPQASVTAHARFWRRAMGAVLARSTDERTNRQVVVGPAANKGLYQDAAAVSFPRVHADVANVRSGIDAIVRSTGKLMNVLRRATPNPNRQHPSRKAALDALAPDLEQALRKQLSNYVGAWPTLEEQLQSVAAAVVRSTTAGSPLRRREAQRRAERELDAVLRKLSGKAGVPSAAYADSSPLSSDSTNSKRRATMKEGGV